MFNNFCYPAFSEAPLSVLSKQSYDLEAFDNFLSQLFGTHFYLCCSAAYVVQSSSDTRTLSFLFQNVISMISPSFIIDIASSGSLR